MNYNQPMNKPLLIVFLGFPGSGKTYFSKRLAKRLKAITFNSDALRLSMFGSLETIEQIRTQDKSRLYNDVFGAMNYASKQAILSGYSVIYDAQMTKRIDRTRIEKLAEETGAIPILVWIKTSPEVAYKRGQERDASDDSNKYSSDKIKFLVDRFADVTDLPEFTETTIEIDGEIGFDEQFTSFHSQLNQYLG